MLDLCGFCPPLGTRDAARDLVRKAVFRCLTPGPEIQSLAAGVGVDGAGSREDSDATFTPFPVWMPPVGWQGWELIGVCIKRTSQGNPS